MVPPGRGRNYLVRATPLFWSHIGRIRSVSGRSTKFNGALLEVEGGGRCSRRCVTRGGVRRSACSGVRESLVRPALNGCQRLLDELSVSSRRLRCVVGSCGRSRGRRLLATFVGLSFGSIPLLRRVQRGTLGCLSIRASCVVASVIRLASTLVVLTVAKSVTSTHGRIHPI